MGNYFQDLGVLLLAADRRWAFRRGRLFALYVAAYTAGCQRRVPTSSGRPGIRPRTGLLCLKQSLSVTDRAGEPRPAVSGFRWRSR
ncbi:hypothetical protein CcI156_14825 [Frankia sp. CcI156]|nr:hypothetical protein CcI6DRAFT_03231 [Frankia sp. CcI6]EYT89990.1 hypothetical protein ThrDRAFT_04394 [Frankia casuarinae]KDA42530.1 hypothetical protein BMG523Draft_02644 [Frankia sp. BMG5.23]KEZ35598.1 hypothetical protein CEDDRAFT_03033 [Frankia sp. CeD]KFB03937.1 hypothetical protein ALLO2DRAFT_03288 [Frankia sp. Allo2]OHV53191.1 hypothetical protein CgIS1_14915 [Frankia sp. CgIS1]ONH24836.1 hypothetical protein CcI156_14825 [Frankia sp. CcI156]ORT52897.1 hypothetical protein KBI5_092